ncbi:hypothetical protein CR513_25053, partial [Mucuna pruriens]
MGATSAKKHGVLYMRSFKEVIRYALLNFKLYDSKIVKDYYYKTKEIVSQMKAYGENILDKKIVEKILISIPHKIKTLLKMSFNQSSNYNLRIKNMGKTLEIKRILEVYLNILHVASARRQVTCRRIVNIIENHNVSTVRNLDMWRRTTTTKISI